MVGRQFGSRRDRAFAGAGLIRGAGAHSLPTRIDDLAPAWVEGFSPSGYGARRKRRYMNVIASSPGADF